MKSSLLILTAFIAFLYSCNCEPKANPKVSKPEKVESGLIFKAIQKGAYSNFDNRTDSNQYYLMEFRLINNTAKEYVFLTMSCASLVNIVKDSKDINFLYHNCSANYPVAIKLMPQQEFSLQAVLYGKKPNDGIRFGFVIAKPPYFGMSESAATLRKMNMLQKNVIWSEPVTFFNCSFHPYVIKNKVNDSTFSTFLDIKHSY